MNTPRTRTWTVLAVAALAIPVTAVTAASPAAAAQNPTSCAATTSIVNGGLEDPIVTVDQGVATYDDSDVPGWQTTASDHVMEFWHSGFNGVPAAEGDQFVELNANEVSTLFQDVTTVPGETLRWSLQHRGRLGTDTLRVLIGDPAGPLVQAGPDISDDNTAWGAHEGTYLVPAGQTTTRFAFESVSAAGGDPTFGNFLDAVTFGTAPCIVTDLKVKNLTGGSPAAVGDTLRYTVRATNNGGTDAQLTTVTQDLPSGVSFVPGSLKIVSGAAMTDAMGDDPGEYDSAAGRVRVRIGTGADGTSGGSVAPGTSVALRFDVKVVSIGAGSVTSTASTAFEDPISGGGLTSTSQTRAFPVAAQLAMSGGVVSPWPAAFAVLMILTGAVLVARSRPVVAARHRA